MRRRRILHLGVTGLFLSLGGCADQPAERPQYVTVRNTSTHTRTVDIEVAVNGNEQFSERVEVPFDDHQRIEETFQGPGLFSATEYTLTATLEDGTTATNSESVAGLGGFDGFVVYVHEGGSLEIAFMDAT